jgi:transcriptional antiterminator NusG
MATITKSQKIFPYKVGDYVKIKKGPFMNLGGIIEHINVEKRKVRIMISIFGRLTPIEVDTLYINKIKK